MALPTLANHPGDRDCPSFDSQAQAQAFFLRHGGPDSDGDRLDADNDGDACETLQGYSPGATVGDDDDDDAPPADNGEDPGEMPDTSTPSDTAPLLPLMLVGLFGGSALVLYRRRLAL